MKFCKLFFLTLFFYHFAIFTADKNELNFSQCETFVYESTLPEDFCVSCEENQRLTYALSQCRKILENKAINCHRYLLVKEFIDAEIAYLWLEVQWAELGLALDQTNTQKFITHLEKTGNFLRVVYAKYNPNKASADMQTWHDKNTRDLLIVLARGYHTLYRYHSLDKQYLESCKNFSLKAYINLLKISQDKQYKEYLVEKIKELLSL